MGVSKCEIRMVATIRPTIDPVSMISIFQHCGMKNWKTDSR